MDNLEKMFEVQKEFSGHWKDFDNMKDGDRRRAIDGFLLDLYDEVSEIRQENNIKAWRKTTDGRRMPDEIVDAFAYLVSIAHCCGISAKDFSEKYFKKMEANEQDYARRKNG